MKGERTFIYLGYNKTHFRGINLTLGTTSVSVYTGDLGLWFYSKLNRGPTTGDLPPSHDKIREHTNFLVRRSLGTDS